MSKLDESYDLKNLIVERFKNEYFFGDKDLTVFYEFQRRLVKEYRPEQSLKPHQSSLELQNDINTLAKKLNFLEAKVSMQDSLIKELEFKINSVPFEKNIDDILNYVTDTFTKLDFITKIYYKPVEDDSLKLIVIHNKEDRAKAFVTIHDKLLNVEDVFPNVNFRFLLLHSDEVMPSHLMSTTLIFPKIYQ